jgi:hypothetical protein
MSVIRLKKQVHRRYYSEYFKREAVATYEASKSRAKKYRKQLQLYGMIPSQTDGGKP